MYAEGDPFKGHFDKSFDPLNLPINETSTSTLHIKNVKGSLFKKATMKAHLDCRDGTSETVVVEKITPEQYSLSFVPQKRGRHELHIMYNDTHICGSPIPVYVTIPPQQFMLKEPISTKELENNGRIKFHGGKIYLTSSSNRGIHILDSSSKSTERVIMIPRVNEVLVTHKHIYATDSNQHKIVKLDIDGVVIKSVGGRGTNPGQFHYPNGIRQSKYMCAMEITI